MRSDFTIYEAKTKLQISFMVTMKLVCSFVFASAKEQFPHDVAQILMKGILFEVALETSDDFSVRGLIKYLKYLSEKSERFS